MSLFHDKLTIYGVFVVTLICSLKFDFIWIPRDVYEDKCLWAQFLTYNKNFSKPMRDLEFWQFNAIIFVMSIYGHKCLVEILDQNLNYFRKYTILKKPIVIMIKSDNFIDIILHDQ